jgi:hypothetical protein
VVAAGLLVLGVVDIRLFVSLEEEAGVVAFPPPGLQTRHAVSPRSLASVSVAAHPVCAYRQVDRWYFAPVLVTNTLFSDCAEAETETNRRMEISRNRNAGIIGGINGLQSGGSKVGLSKDVKAKDKKNTLYRVFLGVKGRKLRRKSGFLGGSVKFLI